MTIDEKIKEIEVFIEAELSIDVGDPYSGPSIYTSTSRPYIQWLIAQLRATREVLTGVQWEAKYEDEAVCPYCFYSKREGHHTTCALNNVLNGEVG